MRRSLPLLLTVLGQLWGAQLSSAQAPDSTRYAQVAVSEVPHATVVTMAVLIPAGATDDPVGLEGTAWLTGHALARAAGDVVGPGTVVTARVNRRETLFTVVSVPSDWPYSWKKVEAMLFNGALEDIGLESVRGSAEDDLVFDAGSPVREFESEAARLVSPGSAIWARPVRGTPESLAGVSPQAVRSFQRAHYRAERTTVAVVAPPGLPDAGAREKPSSTATVPAASVGPAWIAPERFELERQITNAWIAVAWPVDPGLPRTHLEFLAHLLDEEVDASPPDPDRFSVEVRLEDTPGGPVLIAQAAVFPEAADRWETRILGAPASVTRDGRDELFTWRKRRFRAEELIAESIPESRADRIAHDLARGGPVRDVGEETWALTRADLMRATAALGPPRVLRLGPDLGAGGLMPSERHTTFGRFVFWTDLWSRQR